MSPSDLSWFVYDYSEASCTPAMFLYGNGPSFVPLTADGQWRQTPLQSLFIDNTVGSVQLGLWFECASPPCSDPTTRTVWFDDDDFEAPPPTAVTLTRFTGYRLQVVRLDGTASWSRAVTARR